MSILKKMCLVFAVLILMNCLSPLESMSFAQGDLSFVARRDFEFVGDTPMSIVAGDLNGDKILDLAVVNLMSNNVSILLGDRDGTFRFTQNFGAGPNPRSITIGDFDG